MKTINHLIAGSCTKYAERPALAKAFEEPLTYGRMEEAIRRVAAALIGLGVKRGDRVAILAENSPNWGICYLATVRIGGVSVPILPDFPEMDIRHIIGASEARLLFCSTRQSEKILELGQHKLKRIILIDDGTVANPPVECETLSAFMDRGGCDDSRIAEVAGRVKAEDIASLIYTSGTSGHSKAVMLSHANLVSNVEAVPSVIPLEAGCVFLSLLPLSHAYEFTCGFLTPIAAGAKIVYAGARPTPTVLQKICRQEKPWAICIVPMVMEKIYKKRVLANIEHNWLLRTALKVPGLRGKVRQQIGRKLLDFFGGDLRVMAIGGAPLNREVEDFLRLIRFPFLVGYGLTEASPLVSAGPFGDATVMPGSAGKPVRGVQIKVVNPERETGIGDIYVRGPNVMKGYYNDKALTAEALDSDGWLATGDLGYLDQYGNLFLVGRSKSVIVLSHGENIYPEAIEDKINSYAVVAESLVVDRDDRLEAWVYPDYEYIDTICSGRNEGDKGACVLELLEKMRREVNGQLPLYSQIGRMVERREPFVKTATHKIKRYLYK
ncbi:MAG: AMP-binding protein [Thermodesulfobacteriota bacterium]